jgi:hypothetical protein
VPRLVDGDNLLGSWPGRDRSEGERRSLARQIASLARDLKRRIVLVFDGPQPPGVGLWPHVLFSGPGRRADDLILEILRGERDPRGWTVVTNDRSLGDRCRHAGASVERCDVFRDRLSRVASAEKPERAEDVAGWLKVFGEEEED